MCPLLNPVDPADDLLRPAGQIPHPLTRLSASRQHTLRTHPTLFLSKLSAGTVNGAPLPAAITAALYVGSGELTGAPIGDWMPEGRSLTSRHSDPLPLVMGTE